MTIPAKTALMVGHPGHELRVFHWLEVYRPLVCCLTDGSGPLEKPRIDSARRLLAKAGASVGSIFCRVSDKQVYRFILDGNAEFFAGLVDDLAQVWIAAEIDVVAADAAEGFNPAHDLCRCIVDAAAARVGFLCGKQITNYQFLLEGRPDACPAHLREAAIWLHLDEQALARKMAAALDYPELKPEVELAIQHFGTEAFALECLYPADTRSMLDLWEHEAPGYERYGRLRVQESRYKEAIGYRQHIRPIVQAIQKAIEA
ncbi:MAG TPA: hypothetical protein VK961_21670 [Chthoniobacter sp.]|nr:hypothetical protein [Chthoniobacter sp.]